MGNTMKLFNLKNTAITSAFGLAMILGSTVGASAQQDGRSGDRDKQDQRVEKQQQKIDKQHQKVVLQQQKAELQRMKLEQQRQELLRQQQAKGNRYNGSNSNVGGGNRYRVYRNGSYYQTDNRGAELLRQAVNNGYQQGLREGESDRSRRRGGNWSNSSVYRSGNYGYQSYVESGQYQYYFRQGFEKGYQDGYNSRYQYGTNNGGTVNILGTILQGILNIQQY
jgi:hypothetical protein